MSMTQLEKHIASDLIHEEEARCEVVWNGVQCTNSAQWAINAHNFTGHTNEDGIICDPCLKKAVETGYMNSFMVCATCGDSPIIKSIRPV